MFCELVPDCSRESTVDPVANQCLAFFLFNPGLEMRNIINIRFKCYFIRATKEHLLRTCLLCQVVSFLMFHVSRKIISLDRSFRRAIKLQCLLQRYLKD